jgi:hypothetical protein
MIENLIDDTILFFFAGRESTGNYYKKNLFTKVLIKFKARVIEMLMYYLANNPEIKSKVEKEYNSILGDFNESNIVSVL